MKIRVIPMGIWRGVAIDSLKFHLGLPCPTLLYPAGGPPLKWPLGHFRGGPPAGGTACCRLLPLRHPTPYAYGYSHESLSCNLFPTVSQCHRKNCCEICFLSEAEKRGFFQGKLWKILLKVFAPYVLMHSASKSNDLRIILN
jgi:hypothetical protein